MKWVKRIGIGFVVFLVVAVLVLWLIGRGEHTWEAEVAIDAPKERVFDHLTNKDLLPEWLEGLKESQPLDDKGLVVGARSKEIVDNHGEDLVFDSVILAVEPNRLLEIRLESDMGVATSRYEVVPDGDGVKVRHTMKATHKGFFMQAVSALIGGLVQDKVDSDLTRLKALCESG